MLTGPSSSATIVNYYTVLNVTIFNADTASGQPSIQLLDTSVPETSLLSTALLSANGSLQCGPNGCTAYGPDGGAVVDGNSGYSGTSGFSGYSGTGAGTSGFSGFSGFSGVISSVPVGQIVYGTGGSVTSDANLVWDNINGILQIQDNYGNQNVIIGFNAGYGDTSAIQSVFVGFGAGYVATAASYSVFVGFEAGFQATNAQESVFVGFQAGYQSTNAANSVFVGFEAGYVATNAADSVFIGINAGGGATNASDSVFIGTGAGGVATNAATSVFIGVAAGDGATNAAYSMFIGTGIGLSDTINNTSTFNWSMLIGQCTQVGIGTINTGGHANSIFLGGNSTTSNYANTAANQLMITPEISTIVTKANLLGNVSNVGAIVVGAAAGVGATVSVVGTQFGGRITLNAGTPTTNGTLCTLTYATAFSTSSSVVFSPANSNAATLAYAITSDSASASSFSFIANSVGLTASNTYVWNYHVTGW